MYVQIEMFLQCHVSGHRLGRHCCPAWNSGSLPAITTACIAPRLLLPQTLRLGISVLGDLGPDGKPNIELAMVLTLTST